MTVSQYDHVPYTDLGGRGYFGVNAALVRYELFSLRINAGNYFHKKSITFMKISFDFVLDNHVSEKILPSICTGKVFPVSDHMHWKCWDLAGILHDIPSIYTGKAWEIFLVSDQMFCTGTPRLHNSSNIPVNCQQFLTIPSVWSDTGKIL